jgi:hypothetical protein
VLKIRLETDIQNLEQHLETMRATYQLNTEKLEYNYRVLVERDHENQVCSRRLASYVSIGFSVRVGMAAQAVQHSSIRSCP